MNEFLFELAIAVAAAIAAISITLFCDVSHMKTCTRCNCEKPLDRFAKIGKYSDKLRTVCKECTNAYGAERKRARRAMPKAVPVIQPGRRQSVYDLPVYVPPKWGR